MKLSALASVITLVSGCASTSTQPKPLETYRALALDLSNAVLWPVSAE